MQSKAGYDLTPLTAARIDELGRQLTPEEANVIFRKGTDHPFCGNLIDNHKDENGAHRSGPPVPAGTQTAYFAGGCFWGVEDGFQRLVGVLDAVSGYQGGHTENPHYEDVCGGSTGHAETVRVSFDPAWVTYRDLLNHFFKSHKPTQLTRQGSGGGQYRCAIFTTDDTQRAEVEAFMAAQQSNGQPASPIIATEVSPAGTFYEAEEHHQNYHAKHRR